MNDRVSSIFRSCCQDRKSCPLSENSPKHILTCMFLSQWDKAEIWPFGISAYQNLCNTFAEPDIRCLSSQSRSDVSPKSKRKWHARLRAAASTQIFEHISWKFQHNCPSLPMSCKTVIHYLRSIEQGQCSKLWSIAKSSFTMPFGWCSTTWRLFDVFHGSPKIANEFDNNMLARLVQIKDIFGSCTGCSL